METKVKTQTGGIPSFVGYSMSPQSVNVHETRLSNGEKLTSFLACGVIEGFAGFEPTVADEVEAWAFLIKTGQCWSLQGFYGRQANRLLENGLITPEGEINWNEVDESLN